MPLPLSIFSLHEIQGGTSKRGVKDRSIPWIDEINYFKYNLLVVKIFKYTIFHPLFFYEKFEGG